MRCLAGALMLALHLCLRFMCWFAFGVGLLFGSVLAFYFEGFDFLLVLGWILCLLCLICFVVYVCLGVGLWVLSCWVFLDVLLLTVCLGIVLLLVGCCLLLRLCVYVCILICFTCVLDLFEIVGCIRLWLRVGFIWWLL